MKPLLIGGPVDPFDSYKDFELVLEDQNLEVFPLVRRACRYLELARSTYRYRARPIPDRRQQLAQHIVALSWAHPRYGYRRIRRELSKEGWSVSRKQVQRNRLSTLCTVPR